MGLFEGSNVVGTAACFEGDVTERMYSFWEGETRAYSSRPKQDRSSCRFSTCFMAAPVVMQMSYSSNNVRSNGSPDTGYRIIDARRSLPKNCTAHRCRMRPPNFDQLGTTRTFRNPSSRLKNGSKPRYVPLPAI
jgi:hypothetical protein